MVFIPSRAHAGSMEKVSTTDLIAALVLRMNPYFWKTNDKVQEETSNN